MPVDTFWSTSSLIPAEPVMNTDAISYDQVNPVKAMPGASKGAVPTDYVTGARAVYPHFDGVTNVLDDATYPLIKTDLSDFTQWHSAHQARYLTETADSYPTTTGAAAALGYYFVLSGDGKTPINLYGLTMTAYAMLSAADKTAFNSDIVALGVATRLGLSSNTAGAISALNTIKAQINAGTAVPAADRALFTGQIDLMIRKIGFSPLVATDAVLLEANATLERFKRTLEFKDIVTPKNITAIRMQGNENYYEFPQYRTFSFDASTNGTDAAKYAASSDDYATVNQGYAEFIRAERVILTMQTRRDALSANVGFVDPKLDVPNLIYQLQLLYEAEAEGEADSGTEEIKQLHKLLQDYGIMQRLINDTVKEFNPKESDERRRFMNLGGTDTNQASADYRTKATVNYTYTYSDGSTTTSSSDDGPAFHWFALQSSIGSASITVYQDPDIGGDFSDTFTFTDLFDRDTSTLRNTDLSKEEMRIFSMFNKDHWASGNYLESHPIESYFGIERPLFDFTDESNDGENSLGLYRKTAWDTFATQLSDTVTLLNQKNQLKQNEIENATKQQNRHFELGNNALRKMNDLLMTIGRM